MPAPRQYDASGTWGEYRLDQDQRPVGRLLHHHDQSVIDEDFAELLRWLGRALPVPGEVP